MQKELPPYVNATGILKSVLEKIKEAAVPPRFTHDFLTTKLGFPKSGSTMPIIPFLKKIGFLGSDGAPTTIYEEFRTKNQKAAGIAMAKAMKIGYADLYERNEYFHDLDKAATRDFLITSTGVDPKNAVITALSGTIEVVKSFANFDEIGEESTKENEKNEASKPDSHKQKEKKSDFNISYTINLNLPESSDPAVFDAIFKSLKEHILSNEE